MNLRNFIRLTILWVRLLVSVALFALVIVGFIR